MGAESGQGPVQLEQLQGVAVQPAGDQEGREAGRQEEQRTDVSLRVGTRTAKLGWTSLFQRRAGSSYSPCDPRSSPLC